ncbi:MAG: hypothetical protein P8Y36_00460 [Alphaproteobacteria bacterium]
MVEPLKIELGEWLPDLPVNMNPGAVLAKNCLPLAKSYRDFPSLSAFSNALALACKGSFWARASNEVVYNFAGDGDSLYSLTGLTTWSDVSRAAGYSTSFWDFVQFNDRVIATDGGGSDLQYYDMGTSSIFADLPGDPPKCKTLAVVRDFVVGGNWLHGSDIEPGGVFWSGFNNSELWTPSLATQANRLYSRGAGGQVQRIVPGSVGLILREGSILPMSYVGPPTVFKLDEAIVNHGTEAPRSVCWTRDYVFYYSTEGFMQLNRKTFELTPIGAGKINNWFTGQAASDDILNMIGAVDRSRGLVFFAFRTSSASANYNRILCYNYLFARWAYAEIETQYIGEFSSAGANLDTLDAVLGSGGIDINSIPVDTDAYAGGSLSFLAFDSDNEACTFDGAALVAEVDTAEFGVPGKRALLSGVRPIIEGVPSLIEGATVTRNITATNANVGTFRTMNDIGVIDFHDNARYHRIRLRVSGGFNHIQRVECTLKVRGSR